MSLSEFRQTLALANEKLRDIKRKAGEKSSNISDTYHRYKERRSCSYPNLLKLNKGERKPGQLKPADSHMTPVQPVQGRKERRTKEGRDRERAKER